MKPVHSFKFICWCGFICISRVRQCSSFFYDFDDEEKKHRNREDKNHRHWYWREKVNSMRNGAYPLFDCPRGHYRDFGDPLKGRPGGILLDGCFKCPKGYYGNSTGLKSSLCTAPCPKGTYLDRKGGTSIDDCIPCPEGTYGEKEGMTTSHCSGSCSDHNTDRVKYYSNQKGLTTRDECKICPQGYFGRQCIERHRQGIHRHRDQDEDFSETAFDYSSFISRRNHTASPNLAQQ